MKIFNAAQAKYGIAEILNTVTRKEESEPCYIFSGNRKAVVISLDEYEILKEASSEHRALVHKHTIKGQ